MDECGVAVDPSFVAGRHSSEVLHPRVESLDGAARRPERLLVQLEASTPFALATIARIGRDVRANPAPSEFPTNRRRIVGGIGVRRICSNVGNVCVESCALAALNGIPSRVTTA